MQNFQVLKTEKKVLWMSIVVAACISLFGLIFAVLTGAQTVLLDASFNFISAIVSLCGMAITVRSMKGADRSHPMGFYAYEVFIVLIKGVSMMILIIYSIQAGVKAVFHGGHEPNLWGMLVYAVPALTACFLGWFVCIYGYKRTKSDIMKAEAQAWMVNTLFTLIILASTGIVVLLQKIGLESWGRLVDPVLVIVMCFALVREPYHLIKSAFGELMHFSKQESAFTPFERYLKLMDFPTKDLFLIDQVVTLKSGKNTLLTIYAFPLPEAERLEDFITFKGQLKKAATRFYTQYTLTVNLIGQEEILDYIYDNPK